MMDAIADEAPKIKARFVTGSIMRHVVVMTLTSAVGLMQCSWSTRRSSFSPCSIKRKSLYIGCRNAAFANPSVASAPASRRQHCGAGTRAGSRTGAWRVL
jgi:hypothetical protein